MLQDKAVRVIMIIFLASRVGWIELPAADTVNEAQIMLSRLDGFREEDEICSDISACNRAKLWSVKEVKVSACRSCPMVKAYKNLGRLQLSQIYDCTCICFR